MPEAVAIADLLADLDTITDVAQAGVISTREVRLEPGEQRPAAILYLDVVGFTELARELSAESLSLLIDRSFRIFELSVRGQGGYCDKVVGDAALYVFPGHPNHPPACEAALRAAVVLMDRTRQISESLKARNLSLSIRVGISFGEVARQVVGGSDQQQTVMGETVNIAQRLEESAVPNTIQTTIRVLERGGELTVSEKRGQIDLKGFGQVEVHQVWNFKPTPVKLRGSFRHLTPLIGRDQLLAQARLAARNWLATEYSPSDTGPAAGATLQKGRNRLMLFRGVAAVGKSRLAYELLGTLTRDRELHSATGHCTEDTRLSGFASELLSVANLTEDNVVERWQELVQCGAKHYGEQYAERQQGHLPMVAFLIGSRAVDTRGIQQADAASFMLEVKLSLKACCELVALESGNPIVLVFEDLQWMGELKDTISYLLQSIVLPQPLIVIGTLRPELDPTREFIADLFGVDLATLDDLNGNLYRNFDLAPLGVEHGKQMLAALLPELKLPPQIEAELHEKAIGLPYYYEEFARLMIRRNLVEECDGVYRLTREIEDLSIPEDIRMLILGRLDQLEPELRALTGRASVLGRSFLKSLLAKFELSLGTSTAQQLEQALKDLTTNQVFGEEPGDRYFFEHVLTREAAYGALLKTNRKKLHRMAVRVLNDLLVPGTASEWEILPELVRHLEQIEDWKRSHIRCCELLLLMAHTGRYEQWAAWERRAIQNWEKVREVKTDLSPASANLLCVQGWQHYCLGRMNAARRCYQTALKVASKDKHIQGEAMALSFLGTLNRNQGRYEEGQSCYEDALEIARELGDHLGEGTLLRNLGILHKQRGQLEETRDCYERALAIKLEIGDRRGEGITLNNLGNLLMDQGEMDTARDYYERSLVIKRETSDRRGEGITLCQMGVLHAYQGRMREARACYEASLAIFREIGDRRREGATLNYMGAMFQGLEEMDEARRCYESSLEIRRELSDKDGEGLTLANLGNWYSNLGHVTEAETTQLQALSISRALGLRGLEGQVLAELALVYLKQERMEDTVRTIDQAEEALVAVNDFYYLSVLHCRRAHYHLMRGERDAALEALGRAEVLANKLGAGHDSVLGREIASTYDAMRNNGIKLK